MDFWERLSQNSLYLDETDKALEMDHSQVEQFYLPLAEQCMAGLVDQRRLLVGVAGPPGCGKSAFAALLSAVINAQAIQNLACVVGMDGWHYPNSYLDSHTIQHRRKRLSLRSIKGAPETFDVQAMLSCLSAIREGGEVRYPVYSRRLHEPIPEVGLVNAAHRIVVIEGNYLFLDEAPWNALRPLFDLRISLIASLEEIQDALMERHLRGGKPPDLAARQVRQVDLPNAKRILSGSVPGTIVVHKLNSRLISSIEWLH